MDKQKLDPSSQDCAYCETSGAKLTCGTCKAAHYCSKACQKQHWKNGHKEICIAPEKRRPQTMDSTTREATHDEGAATHEECPICFEFLSDGTLCTLPCKHIFHRECVLELRKHGVRCVCPLCRADLPAGAERLYEEASRKYVALIRKVDCGKAAWQSLTAPQRKDMVEVKDMLTNAGNQGHPASQQWLARLYHHGEGTVQDHKEAVRWALKAAGQGIPAAQFDLGASYYDGEGAAQDYKEAARWYRKAADQGHVKAQFNLGIMYHDGEGVSQDFKEAVRWTRKAVDQGDSDAQFNLGVMYLQGEGVPQGVEEAERWIRKAAGNGNTQAQKNLADLTRVGATSSQRCACCYRGHKDGKKLKLKPCPRCKFVFYCGVECQKKHWKEGHKAHCRP